MAAFLEYGLAVGAMNPQTNGNTSVNIDEPLALVVEVVRNSSSLSDVEAGLVSGSLSNDFQNRLTSSKKEL
jgi:hypothetical protein